MAEMEVMNFDYTPAYIDITTKYGETVTVHSSEKAIDSISIRTGCYDGNVVGIGNVYNAQCTITMNEIDGVVTGSYVKVVFEFGVSNGGSRSFGTFYVSSNPSYAGDKMTINATGALGKNSARMFGSMDDDFYNVNILTTVDDVLKRLVGYGINVKYKDVGVVVDKEETEDKRFSAYGICAPLLPEEGGGKIGINIKELLGGIAVIYGGNMVERNDAVYLTPKQGIENGGNFSIGDCDGSYEYSRELYGINSLQIKYLPYKIASQINWDGITKAQIYVYSGTERKTTPVLISQTNALSADVKYDQVVECDWLGPNMATPEGNTGTACFVQGDLAYNTGRFTFPGYNEKLYAGNMIHIYLDENRYIPFVIGEMNLTWDGGFTTEISCSFGADVNSGESTSSITSSATAAQNAANALVNYNGATFTYVDFSNALEKSLPGFVLKEKTIEGWAIKDGTITNSKIADSAITGAKIEDSTITGSKIAESTIEGSSIKNSTITNSLLADSTLTGAKIKDATIGFEKVDTSFIDHLTANDAYIQNLTASVANIGSLTADDALIKNIQAVAVSADYIRATTADLGYMTVDDANLKYANITLGNIDTAHIDVANIGLLFSKVGLIDRATIVDGHITGFLDAVEVNTKSITAGTLIADRILLRGSEDGLLFALNNAGELVSKNVDTLDGDVITDRTISADKLIAKSVTANEIDVEDLFAQDIIASGTITGAELYGTYAEIDEGRIGAFEIAQTGLIYTAADNHHFTTIGYDGVIIKEDYDNISLDKLTAISEEGIHIQDGILDTWLARDDGKTDERDKINLSFMMSTRGGSSSQGAYKYTETTEYKMTGIECSVLRRYDSGKLEVERNNFKIDAGTCHFSQDVEIAGRLRVTGDIGTIHQNHITLNDGVHDRKVITVYDDGDGATNNGSELVVGASGNTFIGSGESPDTLRTTLQSGIGTGEAYNKTNERLYITSDAQIYFYSNCNTIANRKGLVFDSSGVLRPLTAGGAQLGAISQPFSYLYAQNARLKSASSNYGSKLNFGDGEYAYIHEDTDDHLTIYAAKGINIKHGTNNAAYRIFDNGVALEDIYQKKIKWSEITGTWTIGNNGAYTATGTISSTATFIGYNVIRCWPVSTWNTATVSVAYVDTSQSGLIKFSLCATTTQQYNVILRYYYYE